MAREVLYKWPSVTKGRWRSIVRTLYKALETVEQMEMKSDFAKTYCKLMT